jgi:hypothetical protein
MASSIARTHSLTRSQPRVKGRSVPRGPPPQLHSPLAPPALALKTAEPSWNPSQQAGRRRPLVLLLARLPALFVQAEIQRDQPRLPAAATTTADTSNAQKSKFEVKIWKNSERLP